MVVNPRIKFTVRDYMATSDTERFELIEGELLVPPSPTPEHQRIAFRLAQELENFVREKRLGEVFIAPLDVSLSEHNVLQPDILFISAERAHIVGERVTGAPDLAIEVLSPGSEARDRTLKATVYARYGVREYWLVDAGTQKVDVFTLGQRGFQHLGSYGSGEELQSTVLTGLQLPLYRIFTSQ